MNGVVISMLDELYIFEKDAWFMTKDYQNLYRIERYGNLYRVVRFYDCVEVFEGNMLEVQHFMNINCRTHDDIARGGRNGK